jgi:hypothetical protein
MEAHFGKKDSGPPRSIEDEPDFQALAGIVRRLEPARQSALMDVLMEDMLTIPPLVWDVPDVVLDVPDIVLPEINVTELLKDLDDTPKETGQPSRDATKRHPEK